MYIGKYVHNICMYILQVSGQRPKPSFFKVLKKGAKVKVKNQANISTSVKEIPFNS